MQEVLKLTLQLERSELLLFAIENVDKTAYNLERKSWAARYFFFELTA